jgi:hypothetical protein
MTEEIDYNALTSYGEDERQPSGIGSVKVYDGNSWYITAELSSIYGSFLADVEDPDTCEPVKSLVIPIRKSGVTLTPKRRVLAVYKAQMAQVPSPRYSHLLTRIIDRDVLNNMRRLGFKQNFEGFMRPTSLKTNKKGYTK